MNKERALIHANYRLYYSLYLQVKRNVKKKLCTRVFKYAKTFIVFVYVLCAQKQGTRKGDWNQMGQSVSQPLDSL